MSMIYVNLYIMIIKAEERLLREAPTVSAALLGRGRLPSLPHIASVGLNRRWPEQSLKKWMICLKQSIHLFSFGVQIDIIKTGPGRESRHRAHRSH